MCNTSPQASAESLVVREKKPVKIVVEKTQEGSTGQWHPDLQEYISGYSFKVLEVQGEPYVLREREPKKDVFTVGSIISSVEIEYLQPLDAVEVVYK